MYRSCIFCSADLGSNDALERFPVGRSLAFDGERGRLWAICPKCSRWNLAPLEERWEAIEAGERLFRDSRLRAQSENVGLAQLRDGTRLVRVGAALAGELALWRYGGQIARREPRFSRIRQMVGRMELLLLGGMALGVVVPPVAGGVVMTWLVGRFGAEWLKHARTERRVVNGARDTAGAEPPVVIRRADLDGARLTMPDDDRGIQLLVPYSEAAARGDGALRSAIVLRGDDAQSLLRRAMVHVNDRGAKSTVIADSTGLVAQAGSPLEFVNEVARNSHVLATSQRPALGGRLMPLPVSLALEMALHEETERRALDGELAALEEMWRQAEQIAAIADRLPDVPAADPPRI